MIAENPGFLNYPDEVLALGLMYSKSNDLSPSECRWANHVKTFPSSLNTTLFWSEEELDELKGCNIYHLTKLMKKQIAADWETLHEPLTEEFPGCDSILSGANSADSTVLL